MAKPFGTTLGYRDISFIDAFQSSCVWYFREVTNEIGKENTQKFLDALNYGNADISDWQGKRNKHNSTLYERNFGLNLPY